jgi:LAO/AO transport system kinase
MPLRLSLNEYFEGILNCNRVVLSRAITLIESNLPFDKLLSQQLLEMLLPHTGGSIRIGITGVPGVGKSTFIESFGNLITDFNKKIAILAIDPTSQRNKGSIMGDKTRMETLSINPKAYIRPSPAGNELGGVAQKTRETMLLCEAAKYDVILIETVGVGQSETVVAEMTDFFLLLMLGGAGDELQGIKKGIIEMADALIVTKADGDNFLKAKIAQNDYQNALHLFQKPENGWYPQVLLSSAFKNEGFEQIWQMILAFEQLTRKNGSFKTKRQQQNLAWMHQNIQNKLKQNFYENFKVQIEQLEKQVLNGELYALNASKQLLNLYLGT